MQTKTNEAKAPCPLAVHHLTAEEWAANNRSAARKPRPFPRVTRRVCLADAKAGYCQTADGRWWTDNDQLGLVEVLPTSRALTFTLAKFGGAA